MTESGGFPDMDLDLRVGRWPSRLSERAREAVLSWPLPARARATDAADGPTSIIIVTCNGLAFTKLCLTSLFANTTGPFQLILVDNASEDGTQALVRDVAREDPATELVLNRSNRGFAPAVNQGLERATGEILVLLNSDTLLPPGWLNRLLPHLDSAGLVNPTTNRSGNEAEVEADYRTYREFVQWAQARQTDHQGESTSLSMASMFCVAMPKRVYEIVGPLDEQFDVGLFEDDDYSLRAELAGFEIRCADDCFIHHFGQVSFGRQHSSAEYQTLLKRNRERFERKWGRSWSPRHRRITPEYHGIRLGLREAVRDNVPEGARILVVSRGDDELLSMLGRPSRHFPQDEAGGYSGYHPKDSQQCVRHLEALRSGGADYFLLPAGAGWWLDYYRGFAQHLRSRYAVIFDDSRSGLIFDLNASPETSKAPKRGEKTP